MDIFRASPWSYFAALLCFCLPFFTVSCQQRKLVIIPGYRMMTGFTGEQVAVTPTLPNSPDRIGASGTAPQNLSKGQPEGPNIFAIIDFLAIFTAASLGFGFGKGNPKVCTVVGAVAVFMHMALWIYMSNYWLSSRMNSMPQPTGPHDPTAAALAQAVVGQISVSPSIGWYFAAVFLVTGLAFTVVPQMRNRA